MIPSIKDILAILGGAVVILTFFDLIFKFIPRISNFGVTCKIYIARKLKYRRLEKQAIESDIENIINGVVSELQAELPLGWISKASIKWVEKERLEELEDDEMILRIRPLESQDANLLKGVYFFFTKALFPRTKEVIPAIARKAAVLQISRRVVEQEKPFLIEKFNKDFLDQAVKEEPNIANYLDQYDEIDQKGFFMSAFLREIHEIATRARFKELRNRMEKELRDILLHIKVFLRNLTTKYTIIDEKWYRKGPATSYGFILVARPDHFGTEGYVKRAREHLKRGVERLYVMGTEEQKLFAKRVITAIAKISEYRLIELFKLYKDYRGSSGGCGALFVAGFSEKEAEKDIESFFSREGTPVK